LNLHYRPAEGLFGNIALIGNGPMYLNKENRYQRDAYHLVNASLGYETGPFAVSVYADNLFDTEYDAEGYFGGFYTVYSPPRELGVKLAYTY